MCRPMVADGGLAHAGPCADHDKALPLQSAVEQVVEVLQAGRDADDMALEAPVQQLRMLNHGLIAVYPFPGAFMSL